MKRPCEKKALSEALLCACSVNQTEGRLWVWTYKVFCSEKITGKELELDIDVKLMWEEWRRATKRGRCQYECCDIRRIWQVWIFQLLNVVTLTWKKNVELSEVWLVCLLFCSLPKGRQQLLVSKRLFTVCVCVCVCVCVFSGVHTCAIICPENSPKSHLKAQEEVEANWYLNLIFFFKYCQCQFHAVWCELVHFIYMAMMQQWNTQAWVLFALRMSFLCRKEKGGVWVVVKVWHHPVFKELLTAVLNVSINLQAAVKSKVPNIFQRTYYLVTERPLIEQYHHWPVT